MVSIRQNTLRLIISLLLFTIGIGTSYGAEETQSDPRSGTSIAGSNLLVSASAYNSLTPLASATTELVESKLYAKLWMEDNNGVYYGHDWRIRVEYTITSETQQRFIAGVTRTLEINYSKQGNYTDIDYDKLTPPTGEHFIKGDVKFLKVTYEKLMSGSWVLQLSSSVPSEVHFELSLTSEFYYNFSFNAPTYNPFPIYNTAKNELPLSWTFVPGAESYELEILPVDIGKTQLSSYDYDFRNAIRISTDKQYYNLPMAFPKSFILFRVRAIQEQKGVNDEYKRLEGHWSSPVSGTIQLTTGWNYPQNGTVTQPYHWTDPSNILLNKTWQYSVSYAEEGKSAQAIVFYDGLMTPKQNVTTSNTNEVAVVAEGVKDFLGRPAVSIMPAPIESKGIRYYDNVNLNNSSTPTSPTAYDYTNFDITSMYMTPEPLNTTASLGAANYYSGSRTLQGVNSDYIPDADGFTYTRTKFTRDGTNRPISQSGVGSTHKVGGKETLYYYGTTNRKELDRLFGNNAGFANNYKKNMVVDPNGQASVSYIDGSGRTIATGLSGSSSDEGNLDIDSKPLDPVTITTDLSEFNRVEGTKVISTKTILVQSNQDLTFNYSINPATLPTLHCQSGDCYYDLEIYITNDETGARMSLDKTLAGTTTTSTVFTEGPFQTTSFSLKGSFVIGTYQITKVLSLNQTKANDYYTDIITDNNPDLPTQKCFPYISPVLLSGCDDNCIENCFSSFVTVNIAGDSLFYNNNGTLVCTRLNTASGYVDNVISSLPTGEKTYAQIRQLIEDCKDDCEAGNVQTECDIRLAQLMNDMSPGGQYFDNLPLKGAANYTTTGINGWLVSSQNPIPRNDFEGKICMAGLTFTDWHDVRANWRPEWANIMVKAHPEYCALKSYCCVEEDLVPVDNCNIIKVVSATDLTVNLDENNEEQDNCINFPHDNVTAHGGFATQIKYLKLNYLTEGSITLSLNDLAMKSGNYSLLSTTLKDLYHHVSTGVIGTNSGQISIQAFIAQETEKIKERAKYETALVINCHDNSNYVFPLASVSPVVDPIDRFTTPAGYTIRFSSMDWNAGIPTLTARIANCKTACDNMAQQWIDDFRCISALDESTHSDQSNLKQALIAICKGGCDFNQEPNDASTPAITYYVKSIAYTATSFDQIINQYRISYGLTPGGCQTTKIPEDIHTENCGCDKIIDFAASQTGLDYWQLTSSYSALPGNIELYLFNITADANSWNYNKAYDHCINDPILSHLSPAVSLPADLDCVTQILDEDGNPWVFTPSNPCDDLNSLLNAGKIYEAKRKYRLMVSKKATEWAEAYKKYCLNNALATERFEYTYELNEYHYTLYYYDQAGNLVQTVSPEGIYQGDAAGMLFDEADVLATQYAQSDDHRKGGASTFVDPNYAMHTNYKYNSLNQLTEQTTPDGGTSYFFYDKLGRLQASQNLEQANNNLYSYTRYDGLGRIIEVGELTSSTPLTDYISRDKPAGSWNTWINSALLTRTQIVTTYYDAAPSSYTNTYNLENLRNRIAAVAYWDDVAQLGTAQPASASYYSYDINGNVHKLIQEDAARAAVDNNQKYKVIDYCYDLISGNVTQVDYQKNNPQEQFSHKYNYDADNRLTESFTSRNGVIWEKESKNLYYLHGPLARTELGDKQVQAQDYAYTLQGWLKAVNSSTGHKERDMGMDGAGGANQLFGIDAYGYSLHYFNGDYTATGAGALPSMIASYGGTDFDNESPDLFNGNISKMIVGLTRQDESRAHVMANTYKYDQLNRIKDYVPFSVQDENTTAIYDDNSLNPGGSPVINKRYATNYSYDGNGNISFLNRKGSELVLNDPTDPMSGYHHIPLEMDEFTYFYNTAGVIRQMKTDNKLYKVTDPVDENNYGGDLDGHNTTNANYKYDDIGRLISDDEEGINDIQWNVANKITEITKNTGQVISFTYDPMGNRITKKDANSVGTTTTFYVRDAQGNVMATYQESDISGDNIYSLNDFHIYGSSRLGTRQEGLDIYHNSSPTGLGLENSYRELGDKRYELANHLGNVLEVISDRKLAIQAGTTSSVEHYTPDVISYSDYYPFGMLMPNRHGQDDDYRYGFNGYEKDNEIKGNGNSYNYGARMLDPRVGRFLSTDPLESKYSNYSPYIVSGNMMINSYDRDGLEPIVINGILVGYKVEANQGPLEMAADINNPETQKKYGYTLYRKVTHKDIINSIPDKFSHIKDVNNIKDKKFRHLNVNPGEKFVLSGLKEEIAKFSLVSSILEENKSIENGIIDLEAQVETLEEQIVKIEETMEMADELGLGESAPGDPRVGAKMGHIITQSRRNGKRLKIIKKQNAVKAKIATENSKIQKNLKTIETIKNYKSEDFGAPDSITLDEENQ